MQDRGWCISQLIYFIDFDVVFICFYADEVALSGGLDQKIV